MFTQSILRKVIIDNANKIKEPIKNIKAILLGLVPTPNLIRW
jgi:hypothetical protein